MLLNVEVMDDDESLRVEQSARCWLLIESEPIVTRSDSLLSVLWSGDGLKCSWGPVLPDALKLLR